MKLTLRIVFILFATLHLAPSAIAYIAGEGGGVTCLSNKGDVQILVGIDQHGSATAGVTQFQKSMIAVWIDQTVKVKPTDKTMAFADGEDSLALRLSQSLENLASTDVVPGTPAIIVLNGRTMNAHCNR